jgi:predicted aspartyl protease
MRLPLHGSTRAACGALWLALAVPALGAEPDPPGAAEPPAEAVLASLPFDPAAAPRTIAIDLAPKGNARRLPFQLDTGANASVVTPRLAHAMGVKVSRTKSDPYRRRTVLGRDVQFSVDTRRGDTAAAATAIEWGVLGGDFLSHYVVELDFAQRRVRFLDPDRFEVPAAAGAPGEAVLALQLVSNRPALRASLDGQPVDLLIDTGAAFGLLLSGAIARQAGIAFARVPGFTVHGAVGTVEGHAGDVGRLELGPFSFAQVPAVVAPNGFYNLGFPGDSVLGVDLLAQFLVRIDYPRARLWLRRDADAGPLFDPRRAQGRM